MSRHVGIAMHIPQSGALRNQISPGPEVHQGLRRGHRRSAENGTHLDHNPTNGGHQHTHRSRGSHSPRRPDGHSTGIRVHQRGRHLHPKMHLQSSALVDRPANETSRPHTHNTKLNRSVEFHGRAMVGTSRILLHNIELCSIRMS